MNKSKISIAEDFSPYPAGRFPDDGKYNAATFRAEVLIPALTNNEQVEVTFDKVVGIGASFLGEAFGGLVRKEGMTRDFLGSHLRLTTSEPELEAFVKLAQRYIDEAQTEESHPGADPNRDDSEVHPGGNMRYTVILETEEEGGFHVWCPALKGCHSQGETQAEALENIREAIAAYLESVQADGLPLPTDVTIHHVEATAFRSPSP